MIGKGMVIYMIRKLWISVKKYFWLCAKVTKTDKVISQFYKFLLRIFVYKSKPIWFNVESVEQYCTENQETMLEIEPKQEREVYEPAFFELCDGNKYQFVSPPVYISVMHDVMAVGATGLVLTEKKVLCDAIKYDTEYGSILDMVQLQSRRLTGYRSKYGGRLGRSNGQ